MSRKRQINVIDREHSKGRSHSKKVSHSKLSKYKHKAREHGEPYVASSHVMHLFRRLMGVHR